MIQNTIARNSDRVRGVGNIYFTEPETGDANLILFPENTNDIRERYSRNQFMRGLQNAFGFDEASKDILEKYLKISYVYWCNTGNRVVIRVAADTALFAV